MKLISIFIFYPFQELNDSAETDPTQVQPKRKTGKKRSISPPTDRNISSPRENVTKFPKSDGCMEQDGHNSSRAETPVAPKEKINESVENVRTPIKKSSANFLLLDL